MKMAKSPLGDSLHSQVATPQEAVVLSLMGRIRICCGGTQ